MKAKTKEKSPEFIPSELVPIGTIQESKTNPRKHWDEKTLKELAESIRSHGILQPLIVRHTGKVTELVSGARRLRAAKLAGLKEVPCIVRDLTDDQALEIQVIENLQRQDIHPLDEAEGFQNLIDSKKYTVESIAEKIGKSGVYVYQRLKLNNLIPAFKKYLQANEINYGQASLIMRLIPDVQLKLHKEYFSAKEDRERVSTGDIKVWINRNSEKDLDKAPFKTEDSELDVKAGPCNSCYKNTACDSQLFPEMANKRICTDVKCYENKVKLFLEKKYSSLKEKNPEAVKITTSYSDQDDAKGYASYSECKKDDKGAVPALIVDDWQGKVGTTKYVTFEKPKSSSSGSYNTDKYREEQLLNTKISAAKLKVRMDGVTSFFNISNFDKVLQNEVVLEGLCRIAFRDMSFDIMSKLKNHFKWEVEKDKNNYIDYDKKKEQWIKECKSQNSDFLKKYFWAVFMNELFHQGNSYHSESPFQKDILKTILLTEGIDIDALSKVAIDDIKLKLKEKKQAKKDKSKKAKK